MNWRSSKKWLMCYNPLFGWLWSKLCSWYLQPFQFYKSSKTSVSCQSISLLGKHYLNDIKASCGPAILTHSDKRFGSATHCVSCSLDVKCFYLVPVALRSLHPPWIRESTSIVKVLTVVSHLQRQLPTRGSLQILGHLHRCISQRLD